MRFQYVLYLPPAQFRSMADWASMWRGKVVTDICTVAASSAAVSDPPQARKLGIISFVLSIVGIVISAVIIVVLLFAVIRPSQDDDKVRDYCSDYSYQGSCYTYKTYIGSVGSCDNGVKSSTGYCYSTDCDGYPYDGSCYQNRQFVGSSGGCTGAKTSDNFCYYNDKYYHCSNHPYLGVCYKYREYLEYSDTCAGIRSSIYCYYTSCPGYKYDGYCYKHRKYMYVRSEYCSGKRSSDGYCYYHGIYWNTKADRREQYRLLSCLSFILLLALDVEQNWPFMCTRYIEIL